jgi:hypothetical protein
LTDRQGVGLSIFYIEHTKPVAPQWFHCDIFIIRPLAKIKILNKWADKTKRIGSQTSLFWTQKTTAKSISQEVY